MSNSNGGSGWSGWILLFLIGAGVWFFLIRPNQQNDAQKDAIQQVLKADSRTSTGATSVAAVVSRMRRIELSKCPSDFRTAYVEHIHAWESLAEVERESVAFDKKSSSPGAFVEAFLRGLKFDLFGQVTEEMAEKNRLSANYQRVGSGIRVTFQAVERIALSNGAELPKRPEAGYSWVSENPDDFRVQWRPGTTHPEHPNIVASDKERNWKPAQGFKWLNDSTGNLEVIPP